jgi:hypothetical protein
MKLKEIGIAIVLALAITMTFNVASVRAVTGDLNGDGHVNILDIAVAAGAFGTRTGDPTFNPDADVNGDGLVDVFDLVAIAINFG